MDIDPFNFADALLGDPGPAPRAHAVQATCKEEYTPTPEEFAELVASSTAASSTGTALGHPASPRLRALPAKGCAKCGGTGYKGRMGIHELLVATDEIKRLIQKRAPVPELREQARRDGMTTLLQDGTRRSCRASRLQAGARGRDPLTAVR